MDEPRPANSATFKVRERLTYANVMATLAVFIALGGSAWAVAIGRNDVGSREIAKNAVGTSELKNNKTKGKDVDESSLGQVPAAALASAVAPAEAVQLVGTGAAPFGDGGDGDCVWSDFATASGLDSQPAGFYKDQLGRVQFTGVLAAVDGSGGDTNCDNSNGAETFEDFRAFTLPPEYRPEKITFLSTSDAFGIGVEPVLIGGREVGVFGGFAVPAGAVVGMRQDQGSIVLEGLSFRAPG